MTRLSTIRGKKSGCNEGNGINSVVFSWITQERIMKNIVYLTTRFHVAVHLFRNRVTENVKMWLEKNKWQTRCS